VWTAKLHLFKAFSANPEDVWGYQNQGSLSVDLEDQTTTPITDIWYHFLPPGQKTVFMFCTLQPKLSSTRSQDAIEPATSHEDATWVNLEGSLAWN
jgi:hypothetical protein